MEINCEILVQMLTKRQINMNVTCIYWRSSTNSKRLEGRKQPPTFEKCWEIFREIFEKPSLNLQRLSSKFSELNGGSLVVFRISLKFRSNFCLQKRRFETASHCVCYVAGVENARKGFTQKRHFVSCTGSFSCKSN